MKRRAKYDIVTPSLGILLAIVVLFLAKLLYSPAPVLHEEWIAPNVPKVSCLTWDEARAKYNIKGEVLASYMIRQGACR